MLPALFALTLFLSAALLFAVQPMAGKVLLPLAGGTPAVWNTCLVFFQAALLLGYLYAHRLTAAPPRRQVGLHLAVAGLGIVAVLLLRPDPEWVPEDSDYPVLGLAAFLAALVGVPFFVLATTAPLLQRWFAATGHRSAADPYFLYAASNAGSLLGLLGYPFVVEPNLSLGEQRAVWAVGFAAFVGLMASCGAAIWRGRSDLPPSPLGGEGPGVRGEGDGGNWGTTLASGDPPLTPNPSPPGGEGDRNPTRLRVLKWVALAALPSSLLMGVTTHLTTDVAPVPLLWVVPLALYLLSFVIVFAGWPEAARRVVGRVAPALLVFLVVALLTAATEPITLVAGVHLAAFFGVALLCHGELTHDRPAKEHLTTFYLAMSAGGVLGGLFNALVAPVIFSRFGLVEYPLAVVLAGLVRPARGGSLAPLRVRPWDVMLVLAFLVVAAALVLTVPLFVPTPTDPDSPDALTVRLIRGGLMFGLPAVVAFALVRNPARFAGCLAVLLFAGRLDAGPHGETLLVERNFFGTLRVTRSADGKFVRLVHGTTQHGAQRADEPGPPRPLMYYHRNGPVGRLFAKLPAERKRRVAVVGLGCGAMAAYTEPGQEWTFYEIDPAVVRIASDPAYFTFLSECKVAPRVVLGDARRQLAKEPDGHFDLIALDAFSSDAIPVHLLTREALALYARKLAPGGVLAFHLSNRYLDLPPLVARLGAAHDPPFATKVDRDVPSERDREDGKFPSVWAVLARDPADLGGVAKDPHWQAERPRPGPVWRDDFSNLLAVWKKDEE